MKDDVLACLYDIAEAVSAIKAFVSGRTFEEYRADDLLRSAIERKFEIAGEALNRIQKVDSSILDNIRNHRDIISFRNILAHGYDSIDHNIVWSVITEDVDRLLEDVNKFLV